MRFKRNEPQGPGSEEFIGKLAAKLHPNDDFTSGVYFSRFKDGSLLFLNQNDKELDLSVTHPRMVRSKTVIGAYDMVEVARRD